MRAVSLKSETKQNGQTKMVICKFVLGIQRDIQSPLSYFAGGDFPSCESSQFESGNEKTWTRINNGQEIISRSFYWLLLLVSCWIDGWVGLYFNSQGYPCNFVGFVKTGIVLVWWSLVVILDKMIAKIISSRFGFLGYSALLLFILYFLFIYFFC